MSLLRPTSSWLFSTIPHGAIPIVTIRLFLWERSSSNASPTCLVTPAENNQTLFYGRKETPYLSEEENKRERNFLTKQLNQKCSFVPIQLRWCWFPFSLFMSKTKTSRCTVSYDSWIAKWSNKPGFRQTNCRVLFRVPFWVRCCEIEF